MNNYTRFVPQQDGLSTIDAEDINELQRTLEKTQEQLFIQADTSFLAKALFALEHHPDANAMIVDLLEDTSKMNVATAESVTYDEEMNSLLLDEPDQLTGRIATKVIVNETGKAYRKFVLLADEYKPEGTSITYEISYDNITYYPIQANQALPLTMPNEKPQFYLRITFDRSDLESVPRLDAWAILYEDDTYTFRFLDNGLNIGIEAGWDGTIVK